MSNKYPPIVSNLENADPKLYEKVTGIFDLVMSQGELDIKTKILIAMAVDAYAGSAEGVKALAGVAKSMGATEAQIREALRIPYQVAGNKILETIKDAQL